MFRQATGRLSTYIKTSAAMLAIVTLVYGACDATAAPRRTAADNEMSREVKSLGVDNRNDFQVVRRLARTPDEAVPLLIAELHPVRETRIPAGENPPDSEHVLWCIRALRYICDGKDFCAKTRHTFSDAPQEKNRKYWLYFRHHACVSFFAMWPSRGTTYIAPQDAQNQIIVKWREWLKEHPYHECIPLRNASPEQWLW